MSILYRFEISTEHGKVCSEERKAHPRRSRSSPITTLGNAKSTRRALMKPKNCSLAKEGADQCYLSSLYVSEYLSNRRNIVWRSDIRLCKPRPQLEGCAELLLVYTSTYVANNSANTTRLLIPQGKLARDAVQIFLRRSRSDMLNIMQWSLKLNTTKRGALWPLQGYLQPYGTHLTFLLHRAAARKPQIYQPATRRRDIGSGANRVDSYRTDHVPP